VDLIPLSEQQIAWFDAIWKAVAAGRYVDGGNGWVN